MLTSLLEICLRKYFTDDVSHAVAEDPFEANRAAAVLATHYKPMPTDEVLTQRRIRALVAQSLRLRPRADRQIIDEIMSRQATSRAVAAYLDALSPALRSFYLLLADGSFPIDSALERLVGLPHGDIVTHRDQLMIGIRRNLKDFGALRGIDLPNVD